MGILSDILYFPDDPLKGTAYKALFSFPYFKVQLTKKMRALHGNLWLATTGHIYIQVDIGIYN